MNFELSRGLKIAILVIGFILFGLTSNTSTPTESGDVVQPTAVPTSQATTTVTATATTQPTATPKPTAVASGALKPGDSIDVGDRLMMTLVNFRKSTQVTRLRTLTETASSGAIFIIFDASYENKGTESGTMTADFTVTDDQGRKFEVAGGGYDDAGRLADYTLNPGLKRTRLNYYVEIPNEPLVLTITVTKGLFSSKVGEYSVDISTITEETVYEEEDPFGYYG